MLFIFVKIPEMTLAHELVTSIFVAQRNAFFVKSFWEEFRELYYGRGTEHLVVWPYVCTVQVVKYL